MTEPMAVTAADGCGSAPGLRFDMAQAVTALSSSVDLAGQAHSYHMRRVAVMALAVAHGLGWSAEGQRDALYAGLLHDCGVGTHEEHDELIGSIEPPGTELHCQRGADFLAECLPLARFAPVVALHHTPWRELRRQPLDEATLLLANLMLLADRADALHVRVTGHPPGDWQAIGCRLAPLAGRVFHPSLVECFLELANTEAFWLRLLPEYVETVHYDFAIPADPEECDITATRSLAHLFARIVDASSPYTGEHSLGVGRLAARLGRLAGMSATTCDQLEIAGLLHDIGKLRVPSAILDKPATLTDEERQVVRRHSYDSFRILAPVFAGTSIPRWAALHHERLSGTGYPYGLADDGLDFGARVIAVADVLQALAQRRPYRPPLAEHEILALMRSMAADNHLDPLLVHYVGEEFPALHALALGPGDSD